MVLSKKLKRVYILESVKNKLAFLETGNKAFEAGSQAIGRAVLHAGGRTCERLRVPCLGRDCGWEALLVWGVSCSATSVYNACVK